VFAAAAKTPLRVAYNSISRSAIMPWIAVDKELVAKYDLDVELVYVAGSQAMRSLLSGTTPIGIQGIEPVFRVNVHGGDTVMIVGLVTKPLFSIIVRLEIKNYRSKNSNSDDHNGNARRNQRCLEAILLVERQASPRREEITVHRHSTQPPIAMPSSPKGSLRSSPWCLFPMKRKEHHDGCLEFVFDFEFLVEQRPMDALDMLGACGFQDQFDFGFADRHLAEAAAMTDMQNVSPELGNPLGEAREAAGPVRDHN